MRDRFLIFAGLALFVAFAAYPVWHAAAKRSTATAPDIPLPKQEKTCVAPRDYMRTAHMKLLIDWREGKVRNGQREFTAYDGKKYQVSLSQTCLGQCHTNREQFCDRCHTYAGVQGTAQRQGLMCFDCHNAPPAPAPQQDNSGPRQVAAGRLP